MKTRHRSAEAAGKVFYVEDIIRDCLGSLISWLRWKFPYDLDHEDIAQKAIVECFGRPLKWDPEKQSVPPYLLRVARNRALDVRRLQRRRPEHVSVHTGAVERQLVAEDDPTLRHRRRVRDSQLREIVDSISEPGRSCVILTCMKGLTYEEAGNRLGLKKHQVRDLVYKTLPLMKDVVLRRQIDLCNRK